MAQVTESKHHDHRVLIAGDIAEQSRAVGPVLDKMGIRFVHVKTGEAGLKEIEKTDEPFSLVICDQRMDGMEGTKFLARIKERSVGTIRFLITGYSQMDVIISAVNKGAVHRYISKPWEPEQITEEIRSGLLKYEHHLENGQLHALAKRQNGKLYELNCELMETTKDYDKELKALEKAISAIGGQLKEKTARRPQTPGQVTALVTKYLEACDKDKQRALDGLYEKIIIALHKEFTDVALRNGIEMPELKAEESVTREAPETTNGPEADIENRRKGGGND